MTTDARFDPTKYKQTTTAQWQEAAPAWHRWGPTLRRWLGPATEQMLAMADVRPGQRVLDVAAGAGDQTLQIAERVGPGGHVLATDIAPNLLAFASADARAAGLHNVQTQVMDGENLDLPDGSFDVVVSRVGLIYFPDQAKALAGMRRVLVPGGRIAAIVYSTPAANGFFSVPVGICRRRANLGPPLPGQPGPFSLGAPGVLARLYAEAGFRDIEVSTVAAPLRLTDAAECVRFERESFGALHQMLSSLDDAGRRAAWDEITEALGQFDGADGVHRPLRAHRRRRHQVKGPPRPPEPGRAQAVEAFAALFLENFDDTGPRRCGSRPWAQRRGCAVGAAGGLNETRWLASMRTLGRRGSSCLRPRCLAAAAVIGSRSRSVPMMPPRRRSMAGCPRRRAM
jgi:ubiquinone/menaquinone biosynthesis C-methylase UbiE